MYFVYVLKSLRDGNNYVGKTKNLDNRLEEHNRGYVESTKDRRPLRLIYTEMSNDLRDADYREKYLKTAWGKRYLKNRVRNDIT
jgi:putative endonuclease